MLRIARLLAVLLALQACGTGSESAGEDSSQPDLSDSPRPGGPPWPVGVMTVEILDPDRPDPDTGEPRRLKTEIWYPALACPPGDEAEYSYTEEATGKLESPPSAMPVAGSCACRDAPAVAGEFPVVLFSHGAYSLRFQYLYLTVALASRGFIVAAPDHEGNTLWDLLKDGPETRALLQSGFDRPPDLSLVLDLLLEFHETTEHMLEGRVSATQVYAAGHSYGGAAAVALPCVDDRILKTVLITPMIPIAQSFGLEYENYPVQLLLIGGTRDQTIAWEDQLAEFEKLDSPSKELLEIQDAGHFSFTDLCELDWSAIPTEEGMDPATDGCGPQNPPFMEVHELTVVKVLGFLEATEQ